MNERYSHLSLFTGIGGIDIAAEQAGFKTIGQCEIDPYATKILEKHWPDMPRWRDIRDVTIDSFRKRTGLYTVDLISGGFPCQPFSVAGNRKGKTDDRYLWPEMLRVIRELKPHWVLCENVPGIMRIAGDTVCADLEREGYAVGIFDYEAASVGAPHRRERIFFVAHANGDTCKSRGSEPERQQWQTGFTDGGYDMADTYGAGLQRRFSQCLSECPGKQFVGESCTYISDTDDGRGAMRGNGDFSAVTSLEGTRDYNGRRTPEYGAGQRRPTQPRVGGMVDGFPAGMDGTLIFPCEPDIPRIATGVVNRRSRLKCLGNAVVPAQVYPILRAIAITSAETGAAQ